MNVLSLCDGMSCGQIALTELGIKIDNYYASEIEKNAIKVTQDNFPNTIQIGDIKKISAEFLTTLPKIDLILCGFPCRDASICTRQGGSKNWEKMHEKGQGLEGEHTGLYYYFIKIFDWIKENNNKDVKFMVENVLGLTEAERLIIDTDLNVKGIELDSALFSAQERKRLYWTNINYDINSPNCKDVIKDILDNEVDDSFYETREIEFGDISKRIVGRVIFDFKAHDIARRVYNVNYKSPTLTSCRGGNLQKKIYLNGKCRKLTPNEYRKLQTIPDWYKMSIANGQIYNLCGDGWNIETVKHILKGLV